MEKYNKLLSDYFSKRDSDVKKLVHSMKLESSFTTEVFFDDLLVKCGIMSANLVTDFDSTNKYNKYKAYINCQEGNLFRCDKGIKELIKKPVSLTKAQEILAHEIIGLFQWVTYDDLKQRLN